MPKQTSEKPVFKTAEKKFDPAALTQEQRDAVVELEFGVHPKFMTFTYSEVGVNLWELEHAGGRWDGFKQYRKAVGIL